jgi:hypothetical protein
MKQGKDGAGYRGPGSLRWARGAVFYAVSQMAKTMPLADIKQRFEAMIVDVIEEVSDLQYFERTGHFPDEERHDRTDRHG